MNIIQFLLALLGGAVTYTTGLTVALSVFFGAVALLQLKDFLQSQIKKEQTARARERFFNY